MRIEISGTDISKEKLAERCKEMVGWHKLLMSDDETPLSGDFKGWVKLPGTIDKELVDSNGKKCGRKKQRLALWRKQEIQRIVEHNAHKNGIRISRICAWNTSRLAFDGSGHVERGSYVQNGETKYNYSICVFPSGKTYHCDLNASYNIGARYFIRELLKSESVRKRLPSQTNDSDYGTGTTRTLSTLIRLHADLSTSCA